MKPTIEMDVSKADRAAHLQQNVQWATVISAKALTSEETSEKRQIELELPEGVSYSSGDCKWSKMIFPKYNLYLEDD